MLREDSREPVLGHELRDRSWQPCTPIAPPRGALPVRDWVPLPVGSGGHRGGSVLQPCAGSNARPGACEVSAEQAVRYVIVVISFVFDPLAIALLVAGNFVWESRARKRQPSAAASGHPDKLVEQLHE